MSGRKKLPSMTGLQVLISIAENGSTSAASARLSLTQSAVSKQLLAFEQLIGAELFLRNPLGMQITEVGKIYLEHARVAVRSMDEAMLRVASLNPTPELLRLVVPPILGDRWLLPRFHTFSEQHPDIEVQFTNFVSGTNVTAADGIFRYVVQPGDGEEGSYLFGNDVRLVSAPSYWEKLGRPQDIASVAEGVMLEHPQTPAHWAMFTKANGVEGLPVRHITRFGYYSMVIRAALAGQGMALIPEGLITEDLRDGRLVNPSGLNFRSPFGYWFVKPRGARPNKAVNCFEQWLSQESMVMAD